MSNTLSAGMSRPALGAVDKAGKKRKKEKDDLFGSDRGLVSEYERHKPSTRVGMAVVHVILFVVLIFAAIGPMFLLLKFAVTPAQDIIRDPLGWFPHGVRWANIAEAWNDVQVGKYFWNTIAIAAGSWFAQLLVATTGGYVLGILKPKYAKIMNGVVIATMFVPSVVLLVPLYLTILNPPLIGVSLINTWWAIWLPAGANAFNVIIVTRFFDSLPKEIFEAAKVDGAGPFRMFVSLVLPMSKPILGVVSVFAFIGAWKDFLWPMLVLKNTEVQSLAVRLPNIQSQTNLGVFLAALAISTIVPVVIFLIFQRLFLSGAGLGGAVKG